jgi:acyl-CoA dehydrogenase
LPAIDLPRPPFMDSEELRMLEDVMDRFCAEHFTPEKSARYREQGFVDRQVWLAAGESGLLGTSVPEEYGGPGLDFRYDALLMERLGVNDALNFALPLHNTVVTPYIINYGTQEQKQKFLPGTITGETICAVAMTEPGAGSDLQGMRTSAVRDGDHWVINGQKTFISNGHHANLIIVAAKTDPAAGAKGISLFLVETDKTPGFERGKLLHKLGQEARDTAELFFTDMRVPAENLLGGEGRGFAMLMTELPKERLVIGWQAIGMIESAIQKTIAYTRDRKMFGKTLFDMQNTQFKLAECKTKATIGKSFLYNCTELLLEKRLDAATASMAKLWISEAQGEIVDECLQLHGGYGYILEYPIAEMYKDARGFRIYGGASEVMKLLIARSL